MHAPSVRGWHGDELVFKGNATLIFASSPWWEQWCPVGGAPDLCLPASPSLAAFCCRYCHPWGRLWSAARSSCGGWTAGVVNALVRLTAGDFTNITESLKECCTHAVGTGGRWNFFFDTGGSGMPYFSLLSAALSLYFCCGDDQEAWIQLGPQCRNHWRIKSLEPHYLCFPPLQLLQLCLCEFWSSLNFQVLLKHLKTAKACVNIIPGILRSAASSAFCTSAMNRWQPTDYPQLACWCSVLTLWRSESCWWRIRASLVGNCRRHSRQTIFFQSVMFPSSSPVLSEPPTSASPARLYVASTPLWDVRADDRSRVRGFIFCSELRDGNVKAEAQTNLGWNVRLRDLELFGHEWRHLKHSHLLKGSNKLSNTFVLATFECHIWCWLVQNECDSPNKPPQVYIHAIVSVLTLIHCHMCRPSRDDQIPFSQTEINQHQWLKTPSCPPPWMVLNFGGCSWDFLFACWSFLPSVPCPSRSANANLDPRTIKKWKRRKPFESRQLYAYSANNSRTGRTRP